MWHSWFGDAWPNLTWSNSHDSLIVMMKMTTIQISYKIWMNRYDKLIPDLILPSYCCLFRTTKRVKPNNATATSNSMESTLGIRKPETWKLRMTDNIQSWVEGFKSDISRIFDNMWRFGASIVRFIMNYCHYTRHMCLPVQPSSQIQPSKGPVQK